MNQEIGPATGPKVEFCFNFASPDEIRQLHEQCINAARWQLCTDGSAHLQQTYYDGHWGDYVPQVAKQMWYRFLNQYTIDRKLSRLRLLAYFQEPEFQVTDTTMVLYLDREGEESGMAVFLCESMQITPMYSDKMRFVLVADAEPK